MLSCCRYRPTWRAYIYRLGFFVFVLFLSFDLMFYLRVQKSLCNWSCLLLLNYWKCYKSWARLKWPFLWTWETSFFNLHGKVLYFFKSYNFQVYWVLHSFLRNRHCELTKSGWLNTTTTKDIVSESWRPEVWDEVVTEPCFLRRL